MHSPPPSNDAPSFAHHHTAATTLWRMETLSRDERLRLMKFVCSFAWTDLEVTQVEREMVRELVDRLGFDAEERAEIDAWIDTPPPPEEVDPTDIPSAHRRQFVDAVRALLESDGVTEVERENFRVFEELIA